MSYVTGTLSLKEAFIKEIEKLGFSRYKGTPQSGINDPNRGICLMGKGKYQTFGIGARKDYFKLPQDWDAAVASYKANLSAPEIKGYVADFGPKTVSFGCQTFTKSEVLFLQRMVGSSELDTVLTIRGEEITPDFLSNLLKNIN